MTKDAKLPPYFKEYLDERFKRIENLLGGMVEKVEKHERWIEGFEARIGVVVAILGSIFALIFTLVKDVIVNLLKVK